MLALCLAVTLAAPAQNLEDASALKAEFNKAKGRVRVAMLVSPT
jgi:hypothetical protein